MINIFKNKKTEVKEEKPVEKKESVNPKKRTGLLYGVVREPHISEKATNLGMIDQYVFKVFPRTNKNEIRKTIEAIYNVDVLEIKIINIPAKKKRLGRSVGLRGGYKKAIVKIKEGQKIEII